MLLIFVFSNNRPNNETIRCILVVKENNFLNFEKEPTNNRLLYIFNSNF